MKFKYFKKHVNTEDKKLSINNEDQYILYKNE